MNGHFHKLKVGRKLLLKSIKGLSDEQLNTIPDGFSNNIIWNVGHVLVTQQLLVYALSGNTPRISKEQIEFFRKGTKPDQIISASEIKSILEDIEKTVDEMETDYGNGLFKTYKEYPTSYGITLKTAEEAIQFNNIHEALHLGYILAMKKLI